MSRSFFHKNLLGLAVLATSFTTFAAQDSAANEVNVYSHRQEILIRPLMDQFTKETGINVNLVNAKGDVLLSRLKSEGMNSPADVLLSADVGRMIRAQEAGVLKPVQSEKLNSLIPAQYREPAGNWYGLSIRSRVIFAAIDRIKDGEITTYEELADPKWRESICIRSSGNIYNQSMMGSLIAHMGTDKAADWAKGVVENMARKPQGGDRDQIKAVASGECDLAVGNTYYLGAMLSGSKADQKEAAQKVKVIFPNQKDRGAHVNISGAAVTKSSKNTENAIKLIEFLASDAAQKIYAEDVFEYPIRKGIDVAGVVAAWGEFKADEIALSEFAKHQKEAVMIFDRAGWR